MNIGIFGFGVVGSGVKELCKDKVIKVFDIEAKRKIIGEDIYTNDPSSIINDPSIDVVVECLGGLDFPYSLIKRALENHKHVVTSNKEVVAKHLKELLNLAKENNCMFLFEASCGGGIPLINTLELNSLVNEINYACGILNGSTNYILTRISEGKSKEEAMKLARINGFLEADPTQDLEGLDMVRKIAIIADVIYDTFIDIDEIYHYPISNVSKEMIDYLKEKGYILKFAASLKKEGNDLSIMVMPRVFKDNHIFAKVNDEYNSLIFEGKSNGIINLYGKGAGKYPTASAIISDIERIRKKVDNYQLTLTNKYHVINDIDGLYFVVYKDNTFGFVNNVDDDAIIFKGKVEQ